ncbi:unnamed protein product [Closterium sp. NIES-65]|nr:unnamed protein product [Closterium sp. NIES-65]
MLVLPYDSHIPLSPLQRAAVAVGASIGALAIPARADLKPKYKFPPAFTAPSPVPVPPSRPPIQLARPPLLLPPRSSGCGSVSGSSRQPCPGLHTTPCSLSCPCPHRSPASLHPPHTTRIYLFRRSNEQQWLWERQWELWPSLPVPLHTLFSLALPVPLHTLFSLALPVPLHTLFSLALPLSLPLSLPAPLYDSHIPLSPLQRAAVAIGASVGALANPARADLVAAVGETTGGMALGRIRERMRTTEEGRAILEEKPRVTDTTLQAAEQCGRGTFGAAYAHFMRSRRFEPHERPPVRFIDDPELAYVATRTQAASLVVCRFERHELPPVCFIDDRELAYVATRLREVHDFWHTIFALPTTVSGELALKLIEFTQTGLPMCLLASLGAPIRLSPARRSLLLSSIYPWALGAGIRAVPLAGIYYERRFGEDLSDLRLEAVQLLGIYYERRFGEDLSDLRLEAVPLLGIYYERRFGEDLSDLRLEWKIAPVPPRFFERKSAAAS